MSAAIDIKTKAIEAKHDYKHDHGGDDCAHCHHHQEAAKKDNTKTIIPQLHAADDHACNDGACDIKAPHGHNLIKGHEELSHIPSSLKSKTDNCEGGSCEVKLPSPKTETKKHDHDHGDHSNCSHGKHDHGHKRDHKHDHGDGQTCSHKPPLFPLEDFISHAKIPQFFKEFGLNASFLTPALATNASLEDTSLPGMLKTWASITAMHLLNRGKEKLPRLGLTYVISGLAKLGSQTAMGSKFSRFLATSIVAIVEKFANGQHDHTKRSMPDAIKKETSDLVKNLKNGKKWKEVLPSLINIEAKVQLVAPAVKTLIDKATSNMNEGSKKFVKTAANIVFTSLSFVGVDKIMKALAEKYIGKDSAFAASIGALCACCGAPVCTAAATDTALGDSL